MPETVKAAPPVSYPIIVSKLPKDGMTIRFVASDEARAAMAAFLDIPAVESLGADLLVKSWRGEGVKITGRLRAEVVQSDVVTLEPLPQTVDEEIELLFLPEHSRLARMVQPQDGELHLDPEGDDIPETYVGDRIELGTILAEALALGLDPYPRAEDASFERFDTDPDPDGGKVSPFATLSKLKPGAS
ncbi:metal-binding protein [Aureimonas sp. SA4125]|uniref:DUF177 domain-containing protein n=1 Tax=Aureimonas sp. SA4125 TaxID=2826993 RepID=UPI001CC403E5|nr:DUF177 domain-containing protein [Aureimonas sp. SA4125]BDA84071.1 metal-binding protein [Aureimonas sp. SA4125]